MFCRSQLLKLSQRLKVQEESWFLHLAASFSNLDKKKSKSKCTRRYSSNRDERMGFKDLILLLLILPLSPGSDLTLLCPTVPPPNQDQWEKARETPVSWCLSSYTHNKQSWKHILPWILWERIQFEQILNKDQRVTQTAVMKGPIHMFLRTSGEKCALHEISA